MVTSVSLLRANSRKKPHPARQKTTSDASERTNRDATVALLASALWLISGSVVSDEL